MDGDQAPIHPDRLTVCDRSRLAYCIAPHDQGQVCVEIKT